MANGIKLNPLMVVAAAVLVYIFFIRKSSGYNNFQRPVRRGGIEYDGYMQMSGQERTGNQSSANFAPAAFGSDE
jgi:hypothetical protein